MGYFPVRYHSRVVIYERKMFIRLATDNIQPKVRHIDIAPRGQWLWRSWQRGGFRYRGLKPVINKILYCRYTFNVKMTKIIKKEAWNGQCKNILRYYEYQSHFLTLGLYYYFISSQFDTSVIIYYFRAFIRLALGKHNQFE